MKSVRSAIDVPFTPAAVFDHLDVLANHEPYNGHLLVEWTFSGPPRGVGAKARMRAKLPGPPRWFDLEVVDSEPPRRQVEQTTEINGRRRNRGTYVLHDLGAGGTRITFELQPLDAPPWERLAAPLGRRYLGRAIDKSLRGLAEQLSARAAADPITASRLP